MTSARISPIHLLIILSAVTLALCAMPLKAYAGTAVIFLKSGTSWRVPADWNSSNNMVEVIGAGGGGDNGHSNTDGGGGGGGAYSATTSVTLTPATTITIRIGTGGAGATVGSAGGTGGDSWFNGASCAAASVCAKGGVGGNGSTGGAGGLASGGVGATKFNGGDGANGNSGAFDGGGGGGAAGPNGDGGDASGTTGGTGDAGFGGSGGSGGNPGSPGGNGSQWVASHGTAGSGGGGGGANATLTTEDFNGGAGGQFGGGGGGASDLGIPGEGKSGLIIVTYTTTDDSLTLSGHVRIIGNLQIAGSISKGAGTFVIDHPLDPANKLLYHSFVESPDVKNIYDGIAVLDKKGEAIVALPAYFEALNKDYRYQYFPIGQPMPGLYISQGVKDNRFVIAGGAPHGRVSWQVSGIRHDPYIKANPIQNEVWKTTTTEIKRGQCAYEPLCQ